MDSVGVGGAIDSDKYFNGSISDSGSNTILNIAKACESGIASEGRTGPLRVPTLQSLGLGNTISLSTGDTAPNIPIVEKGAAYAVAAPVSVSYTHLTLPTKA